MSLSNDGRRATRSFIVLRHDLMDPEKKYRSETGATYQAITNDKAKSVAIRRLNKSRKLKGKARVKARKASRAWVKAQKEAVNANVAQQ